MADYDGEIKLGISLEAADAKRSASQLSAEISKIFKASAGKEVDAKFQSLQTSMSKTVSKAQDLTQQLYQLEQTKIPTERYSILQKQIEKTEQALEKLGNESIKLQKSGDQSPKAVQRLQEIEIEAEKLQTRYADIEDRMYDMEQAGTAFTTGAQSEKYAQLSNRLADVNNQMRVQVTKAEQLNSTEDKQVTTTANLAKQKEKLATATNKVKTASKQATKEQNKLGKSMAGVHLNINKLIKKFLMWGLGIRSVFVAYRKLRAAIGEAWQLMAQLNDGDNAINKSISEVTTSLTYLKNSLGAAFAPILTVVAPIISKFLDMMADAANMVGLFIAKLTGQKTFLKAIKAYKDYAKSIKDSNKEQKQQLANYDKLNNITTNKDKDTDEPKPEDMFKEVPVDSNVPKWFDDILDKIKAIWDKLKSLWDALKNRLKELFDLFKKGFMDVWDKLKISDQIKDIMDSLKKIWQHLKDIFTDPAVVEAFNRMLDKWAYAAGQIVASIASIILTILQNILGGIEKYLDQNKERIKRHLIAMFDIWGDIVKQLGEFFVAFANIFQAFASDQGKQLTANIIGIFADTFMGISELASKFIRDLLILVTQPIIDNQEQIKAVLTDFLGFLADITGTIKDFIDDTMDYANKIYDEHVKPLFESLTAGISHIVKLLLDWWQQSVQPLLNDFAQKFDALFKEHIQPMIHEILNLVGSIVDAIKVLWENVLQPFIEWFIQNVLPVIMPIIETIYTTILKVFADIADIVKNMMIVWQGIIDFLVGVFTGDWDKAWNGILKIFEGFLGMIKSGWTLLWDFVGGLLTAFIQGVLIKLNIVINAFQNLGQFLTGVFENVKKTVKDAMDFIAQEGIKQPINLIIGFFEGMANAVVKAINTVIDGMNRLHFEVPDWVEDFFGVSSFGFNLPTLKEVSIPRLAQGAVIPPNSPFMAMLGDQKQGTNIEAPLDTIQQALYGALVQAGLTGGMQTTNNNNQDIVVQIDGREIARAVRKEDNKFKRSTGASMFAY